MGLLALVEVGPGGLAGQQGVAEHAQDVVPELEGLAQRERVGAQDGAQGGFAAGDGVAQVQGPLDGVLA